MPRKSPNKLQRVIFSIPFLLALTAVVIIVIVSAWNMYETKRETQETVERLEAEKEELLARENVVANAALDLSTQRGLEEEIREKFSVAKEGERVIVLVDQPDDDTATTTDQAGWWQRIRGYIWPF